MTVNSAQAINPALYKTTGFDPIADFEPVAGISLVQHAIVAAPQLPVNTLKDLIELARQQPGKLTYGSPGNGTFSHLLMEILKKQQKVFITHIPYRGVAPALTDIIAGNISCMVATIPSCLQFIQGGKLKAPAVPSLHRAPALPNVPLANETVPGLGGELMVLMYAPKGTPREHIEQMRRAVASVQTMPEFETFLTAQGAKALKAGPQEVAALTRDELATGAGGSGVGDEDCLIEESARCISEHLGQSQLHGTRRVQWPLFPCLGEADCTWHPVTRSPTPHLLFRLLALAFPGGWRSGRCGPKDHCPHVQAGAGVRSRVHTDKGGKRRPASCCTSDVRRRSSGRGWQGTNLDPSGAGNHLPESEFRQKDFHAHDIGGDQSGSRICVN